MADLQKIADDLSGLTVLEASELTKILEEKWGVSAAAPVAVAAPAGGQPAQRACLRRHRYGSMECLAAGKLRAPWPRRTLTSSIDDLPLRHCAGCGALGHRKQPPTHFLG